MVAELLGEQLAARIAPALALCGDSLRLRIHPVTNGRNVGLGSLAQLLALLGGARSERLDGLVNRLAQRGDTRLALTLGHLAHGGDQAGEQCVVAIVGRWLGGGGRRRGGRRSGYRALGRRSGFRWRVRCGRHVACRRGGLGRVGAGVGRLRGVGLLVLRPRKPDAGLAWGRGHG